LRMERFGTKKAKVKGRRALKPLKQLRTVQILSLVERNSHGGKTSGSWNKERRSNVKKKNGCFCLGGTKTRVGHSWAKKKTQKTGHFSA